MVERAISLRVSGCVSQPDGKQEDSRALTGQAHTTPAGVRQSKEDGEACPAGVVGYGGTAQGSSTAAHSQAPALEGKQLGGSCECLPTVLNPGPAHWPYVFSWWRS